MGRIQLLIEYDEQHHRTLLVRDHCGSCFDVFVAVCVIVRDDPSCPSELEGDVQEVDQDDEHGAAQEHGDGPEDPEKEGEGEVESPQAERPEVTAPVDGGGHVLGGDHLVVVVGRYLLVRYVYQDTPMAVVPARMCNPEYRTGGQTRLQIKVKSSSGMVGNCLFGIISLFWATFRA